MAETPETPEPTPAPAEDKTVPYDRFAQVNTQAKEAAQRAKELEARLQEIEDRDKSDLERERTQRERLEQELQDRESRLISLERGGWIREAANSANFIDPADALGRVSLSEIETESDAKRAVKKIAESAKHLIRQEPETPEIGQVVRNGQPVDPNAPAPKDPVSDENEKFLAELKAANQGGWSSSGVGLLDG